MYNFLLILKTYKCILNLRKHIVKYEHNLLKISSKQKVENIAMIMIQLKKIGTFQDLSKKNAIM